MADNDKYLIEGHYYQYDLKWLIDKLLEFEESVKTIIDLQTIHYADPIQWDITTQYSPNTVVVDPKTGTAYMSKVAVPSGIQLDNSRYWVVIFNYQKIYEDIMRGVAYYNGSKGYAEKDIQVNDLLWEGTSLYRATRAISAGSKVIEGTNVVKTSIESLLATYYGKDRTAQVTNDTLNVSGDYTLNAGDIASTSDNRTVKVTHDNEVDVDGNDSLHVDGASTVNIGGLRTEAYAGNRGVGVTGDMAYKFGNVSMDIGGKSFPIKFPDKTLDLYNLDKSSMGDMVSVLDFGAKGDGVTDDTKAFRDAIEYCITNNKGLYIPAVGYWNQEGGYILSKPLNIDYPMVIMADPNALLNWKTAHTNTDSTTSVGRNGSTKFESGYGINIDYGTYGGHKGVYRFGVIQGDKSYTMAGGTQPSGHYWTGIRIANGDLVDFSAVYISYWDTAILFSSDVNYTANNKVSFMVADDNQIGVKFTPKNGNAIDLTEVYFNTIGISKFGVYVESDGQDSSSFSRVNNLRLVGSQLYTEYKGGCCLFNASTFEESVVNSYFDIMCLFNHRTAVTTLKTGDTSTWYGACVGGTGVFSGNNNMFGGHDCTFNIGVYNGSMSAGNPVMINVGGWGNQIENRWQKFHGTTASPAKLILTPSETTFNGGLGGCLPGRTAYLTWTTPKSYNVGDVVSLYGYAMCLTTAGNTPISVSTLEPYNLFDYIALSDTYNGARQFIIKLKFNTEVANNYKFDFLLHIDDIN